ncbi:ubiquitin-conjugating enzyme E2 2-like [Drosophila obscura]|uniref:ubiquitin-conjugating enzyme E2 2-like n=1 Tax=Drosophila obscura TaxID=7282 RepID=UPI001BB23D55|nr:ubiquitin-conjugating enzyme E2 2-like [Drosophila obscura]
MYFLWDCTVPGEEYTPWTNARYGLELTFDTTNILPSVRFIDEIFHPNINRFYSMTLRCKNIVGNPHGIKDILRSIQRLLSQPDLSEATNWKAGQMFVSNQNLYDSQTRLLARQLASKEEEGTNRNS